MCGGAVVCGCGSVAGLFVSFSASCSSVEYVSSTELVCAAYEGYGKRLAVGMHPKSYQVTVLAVAE